MLTSLRWLHRYLIDATLPTERVEATLMALGLPIETRTNVPTVDGEDACLDVEVTSNRGDCLSHVGLAREVAASPASGVRFAPPAVDPHATDATRVEELIALENRIPEQCPLFVVRVIRGVRVGPSPAWLVALLEAVGQRSINNVVDVTNFIALELGNPCHVFDLAKLEGRRLVVRSANAKETLTTLDGKARALDGSEMVVADASRAQGLAGVMGGHDSEVTTATTDVALEVATWSPALVRKASRRHQLRTTASHRYERIVDARTLEFASQRGAAMIANLAGGRAATGALHAGRELPAPTTVPFRPSRCLALLGYEIAPERMLRHLRAVEVEVAPLGRGGDGLLCTIPAHRPDLTREVDLIEEVARIEGLDAVPTRDTLAVRVNAPQAGERARRELASLLAGLGFFEAVTFSFTTPALAKLFTPAGLEPAVMDDARRGDEPALRPSVLTGLLACRRHNQHAGVRVEGGLRLFEVASAFAQHPMPAGSARDATPSSVENLNLALLVDCEGKAASDVQAGVRMVRGVVESLVKLLTGGVPQCEPSAPNAQAFDASAFATLSLGGAPLGYLGAIAKPVQDQFDLAAPVIGCEVALAALLAGYPPRSRVVLPPAFPGIERDVSLIVNEDVRWDAIATALEARRATPMEAFAFVTTYRGKPLPAGKKSVTVRLAFRDPTRTLTHEEVDAPVQRLLESLKADLAFELRA
jgi:phenylalanyl-tRNA synthetase beta chain